MILLLALATVFASEGEVGCPCLPSLDLSRFQNGGVLTTAADSSMTLPLEYGQGCSEHDHVDQRCSGACSPNWCSQRWCWVDPSNCAAGDVEGSSYFPGAATYSYATCGSIDRFSGFYNLLSATPRVSNLVPPLVSATSCMSLTSMSDACGPLVPGRVNFTNNWCALKQQVESGALGFADVLRGTTLDITIIPEQNWVEAYWVETGGVGRLGGMVGDILNHIAVDAGFTYRLHALPKPECMGYPGWERWTIDQVARADLVAQWTTDKWERQTLGVSWPFHHLNLDHVLVVRARGASLSVNGTWDDFVRGTGKVCVYGGVVTDAMSDALCPGARTCARVLKPVPAGSGETDSHRWAAGELRAGNCAAYVQPKDRAEQMLAMHNALGGCDLRLRQPSGLPARGGGFATILPFAREKEARDASGDVSITTGGGACTDVAIAAFTRVMQKMHVGKNYTSFRADEIDEMRASSGTSLVCHLQECESGELDLGFACLPCDSDAIRCEERYNTIAVKRGFYRGVTNMSASGVLRVGKLGSHSHHHVASPKVSAWACPMYHACHGTAYANSSGATVDGNASASCAPGHSGAHCVCAPGHGGVLCAICEPGYRRTMQQCKPCSDRADIAHGGAAATQLTVILALVLLTTATVCMLYMRSGLRGTEAATVTPDAVHLDEAPMHVKYTGLEFVLVLIGRLPWQHLATLIKILLGYLQIMSVFTRFDYVFWPDNFVAFLSFVDLASLMELLESMTLLECIPEWPLGFGFESEFYLTLAVVPVGALYIMVLSIVTALTAPAPKGEGRLTCARVLTPQVAHTFEWAMLLCYPLISRICFQVLDFIEYDDDARLLRAQPTIEWGSAEYTPLWMMALAVILLFCVGLPLVVLGLSYRAFGPSGTPERRVTVELLTASYKAPFFYFEAIDLLRKLLLSSIAVIISPRSRLQLFFGAVVSGLAVIIFVGVQPYKEKWFNFLQSLACLQILLTFVAASVLHQEDGEALQTPYVSTSTTFTRNDFGVILILLNSLCLISLPCYAVVLYREAQRIRREMMTPPDPSRPTVWLTSNCLSSDRLKAEFVRLVVMRKLRRPLDYADTDGRSVSTTATEDLKILLDKYAHVLSTIKVMHLNDSQFYHDPEYIRADRAKGTKGGGMFWWDNVLVEECGFKRENIITVQILNKPWLFNRPGDDGMHHAQAPNVSALAPADEAEYTAALMKTRHAFEALTAGATSVPPYPTNGNMNCADVLAKASLKLDDKYAAAHVAWCEKTFDEVDIVCGQGGNVVMTNMAYQVNQPFAKALVAAVRTNRALYVSHSAGTMVTAKSMEMTGEITPGVLEAFAVNKKYLPVVMFNAVDLSEGGIANSVLGALPLFKTPFAMRPHYSEAWVAKVREHNQMARDECCAEAGIAISSHLVAQSGDHVGCALQLLDIVGQNRYQMRPVFVPLRDGKVMEMQIIGGKEVFRALDGTLPPALANPNGKSIAENEHGTFASNLGWTASVKVDQGAGSAVDVE